MNSDALGLFFQVVEIRFSFKANAFKNEIVHCVYGVSRSYVLTYYVRNQIQTHMVIACVFTFSLLLLFVFACCVAFVIQLIQQKSMFHFFFAFRKYFVRQNFLYRGDERTGQK